MTNIGLWKLTQNIYLLLTEREGGIGEYWSGVVTDPAQRVRRNNSDWVPRFHVLPNFHSCLYKSIETRYMFSIS